MALLTCNQQPLPWALVCAFLLTSAGLHAASPDDHPLDLRIPMEDHPALDEHVLANMEMGDCVADCGKVVTLGGRPVFVLRDGSGAPSFHFVTEEKPEFGRNTFWSMALDIARGQDALRHIPTLDEALLEVLDTRECVVDCGKTFFMGGHYTLVWRNADGHPSLHLRGDGNDLAWAPIFARYDVVRPRTVDISSIETGCPADCRTLVRVGARLGLAIRDPNGGLLLHFASEPPMAVLGRADDRQGSLLIKNSPVPTECPAEPTANSGVILSRVVRERCVCTQVEVPHEVYYRGKKVVITVTGTRWSWAETKYYTDCFGRPVDTVTEAGNVILPAGTTCPC